MSIITQADVEQRIGASEVTRCADDSDGNGSTANLARIIADGEGEVLGRIGQAYTLPLSLTDANTSAMVKAALLDVIVYRLLARRMPIPEDAVTAYKAAIAWSEKIAAGTLGLVGETEPAEAPANGGRIVVDASERVISRDSMAGL